MAKGNYYTPQPLNLNVQGIRLIERAEWDWKDYWTGSMESLVAAGFATQDMFPGQPGRPSSCVTYRPLGGMTGSDVWWHMVPRYIQIQRVSSGSFSIQVTVSREEQKLRKERRLNRVAEHRARLESRTTSVAAPAKPRSHLRLVWSAPQ